MKTKVQIVKQAALTSEQKERMWEVYRHYYNYSRSSFMDRFEKNTHFALYCRNGEIGGFTGLRINKLKMEGRRRFLIYFGQTSVPWGYKGGELIPITAGKILMKFWKDLLLCDSWVWFDALTFKAYLVAAKTVPTYFPHRSSLISGLAKK